jgi:very-short-patch-repair endonuclease
MRANPTEAERRLWSILRGKRLAGYKFKRQQAIGSYIVDFVNFARRLIVEADGSQHAGNADDIRRDAWLKTQGFNVLRLWNNDILAEPAVAEDAIWHALQAPLPVSPRLGERP